MWSPNPLSVVVTQPSNSGHHPTACIPNQVWFKTLKPDIFSHFFTQVCHGFLPGKVFGRLVVDYVHSPPLDHSEEVVLLFLVDLHCDFIEICKVEQISNVEVWRDGVWNIVMPLRYRWGGALRTSRWCLARVQM
mgnify:CR=1 FL=1